MGMIKFFEQGWRMFTTSKMQFEDLYKDGSGKGLNQRFLESNFKELDDYSIDQLENLIDRVLDPTTCDEKYIKHFESMLGITVFPSYLVMSIRRKVIAGALQFYSVKGTKKGYESLFNLLNATVIFTETFNDNSFDSPVTLDDTLRRFDMGRCFGCSDYTLAVTINSLVSTATDVFLGLYSIAKFNHPIGAKLTSFLVDDGVNPAVELASLMLVQYGLNGGNIFQITGNDGYYLFTRAGWIVPSNKGEANLKVINSIISLNI